MKKHKALLFVLFAAIFFLAACNEPYEHEPYEQYDEIYEQQHEPYEQHVEVEEVITWQEAYANFLRDPSNFNKEYFEEVTEDCTFTFALRDLTGDGTPELLIYYVGVTMAHGSGFLVYIFEDSEVVFLDFMPTWRAHGQIFVSDDPHFPGVFFGYAMFDVLYKYYGELIDGKIVITEISEDHGAIYSTWQQSNHFLTYDIIEINIQNMMALVFEMPPQATTWQEAYMSLLRDYELLLAGNGYFLIHDLDMDNIPELLIFELTERDLWGPFHLNVVAAYAFRGGSLVSIDAGDIPSNISGVMASPDLNHGLLAHTFGNEANSFVNSYVRLVMDGDKIVVAEDDHGWWIGWYSITSAIIEANVHNRINHWQPGSRYFFEAPASTFQISDEILISIAHMTDDRIRNEFLEDFDSFILFCEFGVDANDIDKYYNFASGLGLIAFATNAPLHNFRYIEINGAEIEFFVEEAIYSLDVLTPEEPLFVNWSAWGSMPNRGISFVYDGITRYFAFHYDARGYEAFSFWEFPILRAWAWGEDENEITFMPNSILRDFRVFNLESGEVMQVVDEVSPDNWLVTTWSQQGDVSSMGISFIDENNLMQYFYLDMNERPRFASDGDFLLTRLTKED